MQILFYLVVILFLIEDILSDFSERNCGQNKTKRREILEPWQLLGQ